jgi:hypothetical protein
MLASPHQSRLEEDDEPRTEPVAGHQENLGDNQGHTHRDAALGNAFFALRSADTTTRAPYLLAGENSNKLEVC